MIIYKITNRLDGKVYIGQTVQSMESRWKRHKTGDYGRRTDSYLYRAIALHGEDNFKIEQIDSAETLEELNIKEETYIKAFGCLSPNGYNLHPGGNNKNAHPETRDKISKTLKERSAGISASDLFGGKRWNKGRNHTHSQETKALIASKLKGRPFLNRWTGGNTKKLTDEQKAHLSALNKGKPNVALYKAVVRSDGVEFESVNAAAAAIGVNRVTITALLKSGKTGRAGFGFKFK